MRSLQEQIRELYAVWCTVGNRFNHRKDSVSVEPDFVKIDVFYACPANKAKEPVQARVHWEGQPEGWAGIWDAYGKDADDAMGKLVMMLQTELFQWQNKVDLVLQRLDDATPKTVHVCWICKQTECAPDCSNNM